MLIFFWLNGAASTASTHRHPRSGIRPLTRAMLKRMERRAAAKIRQQHEDDEAAIMLLLGVGRKDN